LDLPHRKLAEPSHAHEQAFIKENDETLDELPDRPVSPNPNFVTAEGLAAIEAQLARLQQDYARAQGASDRAALVALSRELRYWIARKASAQVVATPVNPTNVQFGSTVTILRDEGPRQSYRIVGEDEADPAKGKISYVSPVARALMGRQVGHIVRVGNSDLELIAIS
jgi:transcription elongation GreA/GreB family factor